MTGYEAREVVESAVRRELFGPALDEVPVGKPLDCSGTGVTFESNDQLNGQFYDRETLEEVLTRSDPLRRYGVGVLHSGGAMGERSAVDEEEAIIPGLAENEFNPDQPQPVVKRRTEQDVSDSDDFDLSDTNRRKPSAMAISFKIRVPEGGSLKLQITGAYYDPLNVSAPSVKKIVWWVRRPFVLDAVVGSDTLRGESKRTAVETSAVVQAPKLPPRIVPSVSVFTRMVPRELDPELRLITVAVVDTVVGTGPGSAFFQVGFTATAENGLRIEPYPELEQSETNHEEESIALLYRHRRTFAVGHGCAATWGDTGIREHEIPSVPSVAAQALPSYEVASLTPDVYEEHADGIRTRVSVSMEELAGGTAEGDAQVKKVLSLYGDWIEGRAATISDLPARFQSAAYRHIGLCRDALERMREGWYLVQNDRRTARAFQLANRAMLYQQVRSRLELRNISKDEQGVYRPVGAHPAARPREGDGRWRAFQIAFILASLPEIVNPAHPRRTLVDLIFFPTGGGKTEAYLGASAISLLSRRLRDPNDAGTDTLMRYTLRLLTAQQFLRASSLICVLEDLRSQMEDELGSAPFGIGVWLGNDSTPNSWKSAERNFKELKRNYYEPNRFLLLKCPWCGTRMGPIHRAKGQDLPGYVWSGGKLTFRCIDDLCRFSRRDGLPVHVVDEDIYESRPSIVIGTVDKFATMAWQPAACSLFGLDGSGKRIYSPPSLIIQDELHLISGPLGSMVGLYEPVIDDLTTDRRKQFPIPAKIIASTATVRQYEEQIKGLFGRKQVALFPPHGLQEGHSFFAEPAREEDGSRTPGRRYLGVMSSSLGSTQTVQVRVAAATLQAGPKISDPADRDGYWTNLNFLNSLRELGNTLSLLDSDIPDYLVGLQRRDGITPRYPRNTMELTSRRRSDEIPKAIEDLEFRLPHPNCVDAATCVPSGACPENAKCIDICLASNIIEVGVDIDRLGLMTIVGQPKTTAQYIQVSGRVGRKSSVPGLVITIYGAAKPRDRSHYERFRTYHQQLYAQVEPTSVTPFAEPVLKRALHAAAISWMRQIKPPLEPNPFPQKEFDDAIALLRARADLVDREELPVFDAWARERSHQWAMGERTAWAATSYFNGDPKQGLMRPAGELADPENKNITWDTPMSMRTVDAECRLDITLAYVDEDVNVNGSGE